MFYVTARRPKAGEAIQRFIRNFNVYGSPRPLCGFAMTANNVTDKPCKSLSVFLILFTIIIFPLRIADAKEDISYIFCDAIADEKLYDEKGYHPYKMLVQGKDGWIFRSESDLTSDFSFSKAGIRYVSSFSKALDRQGTELVILLTPSKGLMYADKLRPEDARKYDLDDPEKVWANYRSAVDALRSEGLHVVSMGPPEGGERLFYKRDHHWNSHGARKAAGDIAEYIKKMPVYWKIEKVKWQTEDLGPYEFEGVSKKVFSDLCDTRQPPEEIHVFNTVRTDMTGNEEDLFGEMNNPDIALLGTSNSTPEPSFANFHGFLREELEADVINMSVSGGGLDTAVISYLNSQYYKEKPAKIAIWEVPGYYGISEQHDFFRQSLPAVYGDCSGKALASRENMAIYDNSLIALSRLAAEKIRGSNHYIYASFSKPVRKYLTFDLRYQKGREKIKIRRENHYPPDGEYYLALSDSEKSYLDKVVLYVPDAVVGETASVKICRIPGTEAKRGWLKAWFGR
jgi:alginate biosynthesis protein AlgX